MATAGASCQERIRFIVESLGACYKLVNFETEKTRSHQVGHRDLKEGASHLPPAALEFDNMHQRQDLRPPYVGDCLGSYGHVLKYEVALCVSFELSGILPMRRDRAFFPEL